MDESTFETFEEELGKPLQEVPPSKPVRQSRTGGRAEMYAQRRVREEAPVVQQVPKIIPREHPLSGATSLRRALSIQNLSQMEVPWAGVTLNRCLMVAVTLLLLNSGLQRIQEAVRGRKDVGEELVELHERHHLTRRGKITAHEPDSSLWDTLFWWLDDDDDDEGSGKSKRASGERVSRGLKHRALPDLKLLKKRKTTFSERRGRGRGRRDGAEERQEETKRKVEEDEDVGKVKKAKKSVKVKPKAEKKE